MDTSLVQNALGTLTRSIETKTTAVEALQYTQAILNLAHVIQCLKQVDNKAKNETLS